MRKLDYILYFIYTTYILHTIYTTFSIGKVLVEPGRFSSHFGAQDSSKKEREIDKKSDAFD